MKQILSIANKDIAKVENESIKGFIFDINCLDNTQTPVALSDMKLIDISITLRKKGGKLVIFDGTMAELLSAMYAQSMDYEVALVQYNSGYKLKFKFPDAYVIKPNEVLEVETDFDVNAFGVTLDLNSSNVEFETIPSPKRVSGFLPVVEVISIGNGELNFNKVIGSDIARIVVVTDFDNTKTYDTSTEAKITKLTIDSNNRQVKDVTENLLIQENIDMINDVDYSPRNLVVYQAQDLREILNNVKLNVSFSKAVTANARVLVVRFVRA